MNEVGVGWRHWDALSTLLFVAGNGPRSSSGEGSQGEV